MARSRLRRVFGGSAGLIALFVILTAVPMAILTFSSVHLASDAVGHDAEERVDQIGDLAATIVREDLQSLTALVASFADRGALSEAIHDPSDYDAKAVEENLAELRAARSGLTTVLLADPEGRIIGMFPPNPDLVGSDLGYLDWYRHLTAIGHSDVSEAFLNPWHGYPLSVAIKATVDEPVEGSASKQLGTVVAVYGLEEVRNLVEEFASTEQVDVAITDRGGMLVAAPGGALESLVSRRGDPGVRSALGGKATLDSSGSRLTAYTPVRTLGWSVVASVEKRNALTAIGHIRSTVFSVAAMLGLLLVAGLLILRRALLARRRAEVETKNIQRFLASVIENIPHMLWVKEAESLRFLAFNRAGEQLLGRPRAELLDRSAFDLLPPDDAKSSVAKDRDVLESGTALDIPAEAVDTADGRRILHTRKIPIVDLDGTARYLLGISEDVTEHRRMEEAVRESEARYRMLVENAPDMVFTLNPEGVFTSLNTGFEKLTGWRREEWIGKGFAALLHPSDVDVARRRLERMLRGEQLQPFQMRLRTAAGDWRFAESVASPLVEGGKTVKIMGIVRDMTERKRLEAERDQFFTISLDLLCVVDFDGFFKDLNPIWEQTLGWTLEELKQRPSIEFVHPDDRETTLREFARLGRGSAAVSFENRYRHKSGTHRWFMWSASASEDHRVIFAAARDITDRKRVEEQLHRAKYEAETARVEAEKARIEAEKAREEAERANQAKSEFLSRMSHELRTPLNAVLGFGQLLEMDGLNDEQQESVTQILKGGRHLLDLINEVLDIARIEVGRIALSLEPVAVDEAVMGVVDLIRPLAAEQGIRLDTDLPPLTGFVTADRQRLKQVLLNLLSNAVKYNKAGGSVVARSRRGPDGVRVDVIDDGPGIGAEHVGRMFVPFERLGAEGSGVEGTGLGLALSKRLVEVMGGSLEVDTEAGRGSTFSVVLPGATSPEGYLGAMDAHEEAFATFNGEGTVLQIEDNPANIKLIERILSGLRGVRLMSAMQGSHGLDMARQHRPDLILLDLNLPDMHGHEVLGHLKSDPRTKDIPVVVVSADATPEQLRRLRAGGARAYLTKPVDIQRFLGVVDEALKERRLDHAG